MKPTLPSAKMHLESCKGRGAGATLPSREQKCKTNNTGDSHVVTHRSTNPAITCLYMAERTGCLVLTYLWSFVLVLEVYKNISLQRPQLETAAACIPHQRKCQSTTLRVCTGVQQPQAALVDPRTSDPQRYFAMSTASGATLPSEIGSEKTQGRCFGGDPTV